MRSPCPFNDLTGDVARLVHYVAINQLFTPSPVYDAAITPPKLPSRIHLDINFFEGMPALSALPYLKTSRVVQEVSALQPLTRFTASVRDQAFTPEGYRVYLCFVYGPSCYGNRLDGYYNYDLFLYYSDHLTDFLTGRGDYELPIFVHATSDAVGLPYQGFTGYDPNTGVKNFIYMFTSPFQLSDAGPHSLTLTAIHEVGHHLGLSHSGDDGYDSETHTNYQARGDYYFACIGDEVNSAMSYQGTSNSFSQFDRDSMDRWLTAAYINQANQLLLGVSRHPHASNAMGLLHSADEDATAALIQYDRLSYREAVFSAKSAYTKVAIAAGALRAPMPASIRNEHGTLRDDRPHQIPKHRREHLR